MAGYSLKSQIGQKRGALDAMARKLEAAPAPTKLQAEAAPQNTGELSGFKEMRQRTEQRANASGQTVQDALKRRLSAAGVLNSGAGIKAMEQAAQQSEAQKAEAVQGVEAEGQQALRAEQEAVKQRNFARDQSNVQADFQDKVFRADTQTKLMSLGQGLDQTQLAVEESRFNRKMANRMQQWQEDNTGGLFGGGGFLGLGL